MMAVKTQEPGLYWFADQLMTPDLPQNDVYQKKFRSKGTPIIIDNGSWQCRVGWGSEDEPRFVFKSVMARMRGKRGEPDYTLVGNDISNIEAMRSTIKNQFDKNVVVNFSNQEQIFDHIFNVLGLSNETSIHHPVIVSEPPCNPQYCQNAMTELLFECYNVPSLSYGVDGLYNLYHTLNGHVRDALVINSGYQTTHIMPVLDGHFEPSHCKRINVGGLQVSHYLLRLLQLRYPSLQSLLTLSRAEELVHNHCVIADDYIRALSEKSWPQITIQLPFNYGGSGSGQVIDFAKQEEKDQQRRERARQHLLRLSQTKREEKIRDLENQLEKLIHLQQLLAVISDPEHYQSTLEEAGFVSLELVLQEITSIQEALEVERTRLQATQQKMQGGEGVSTGGNEQVDPQWIQTLQLRKKELLDQKKVRQHQKQEFSKRRSAASQDRMRIISKLAEDDSAKSGRQQEDTFGMDDEDWNVYRAIHKPGSGGSDSEREEAELVEINKLLQRYDPQEKTAAANPSAHYQLKVGVELYRAPELMFQPTMMNIDQCGLSDVIELVLHTYPPDIQQRLMECVFVCGGNSQFSGLEERLQLELTALRPFQSSFKIQPSIDKICGGWKGMSLWSRHNQKSTKEWFTRSDYNEQGPDYRIEHVASNKFVNLLT